MTMLINWLQCSIRRFGARISMQGRGDPVRSGNAQSRAGYSLVEAVLATALLAIGLGAVTTTVSMAVRTAGATSNMLAATHTARQQLEQITTNTYNHASLEFGTYTLPGQAEGSTYVVSSVGNLRKRVRVRIPYENPVTGGQSWVEMSTRIVDSMQ